MKIKNARCASGKIGTLLVLMLALLVGTKTISRSRMFFGGENILSGLVEVANGEGQPESGMCTEDPELPAYDGGSASGLCFCTDYSCLSGRVCCDNRTSCGTPVCSDSDSHCSGTTYHSSNGCGSCTGTKTDGVCCTPAFDNSACATYGVTCGSYDAGCGVTVNCGSCTYPLTCVNGNCSCTDSSWSPDPSTVCSGTSFTQTSNCGRTQSSTGTKTDGACCTPTNSGCAASTCTGTSCWNGCAYIAGTKTGGTCCVPTNSACAASTCSTTTCNDGCKDIPGTKTGCTQCGNGVVEGSEQCDNGSSNGACPSACSTSCTNNSCPTCTPTCNAASVHACFASGANPTHSSSISGETCCGGQVCYGCDSGYAWNGSACVSTAKAGCDGSCTSDSDCDTGLTCSRATNKCDGATCHSFCTATCSTGPGCLLTLANGSTTSASGTCCEGSSCFQCNSGYTWNGSNCVLASAASCSLSFNPNSLSAPGTSYLSWSSTNADVSYLNCAGSWPITYGDHGLSYSNYLFPFTTSGSETCTLYPYKNGSLGTTCSDTVNASSISLTLNGSCNASGNLSLSWSGGPATSGYHLRIDDISNNSSGCSGMIDGWYCPGSNDLILDSYSGSSYDYIGVPGRTYNAWVHPASNPNIVAHADGIVCAAPVSASCAASFNPASLTVPGTSNLSWSSSNADVTYMNCTGSLPIPYADHGLSYSNYAFPFTTSGTETCNFYPYKNGVLGATCSANVTVIGAPPSATCSPATPPAGKTACPGTQTTGLSIATPWTDKGTLSACSGASGICEDYPSCTNGCNHINVNCSGTCGTQSKYTCMANCGVSDHSCDGDSACTETQNCGDCNSGNWHEVAPN